MTCKWLKNHGNRVRPQDLGLCGSPSKWPEWLKKNLKVTNHLLTGIILQIGVSTNWKNIGEIWSLAKQRGNKNLK